MTNLSLISVWIPLHFLFFTEKNIRATQNMSRTHQEQEVDRETSKMGEGEHLLFPFLLYDWTGGGDLAAESQ